MSSEVKHLFTNVLPAAVYKHKPQVASLSVTVGKETETITAGFLLRTECPICER